VELKEFMQINTFILKIEVDIIIQVKQTLLHVLIIPIIVKLFHIEEFVQEVFFGLLFWFLPVFIWAIVLFLHYKKHKKCHQQQQQEIPISQPHQEEQQQQPTTDTTTTTTTTTTTPPPTINQCNQNCCFVSNY